MNPDHRHRSLDSLRGVAAAFVILFHVNWDNHITRYHFFREAFLFVDLFFILSGFVIATVYSRRIGSSSDAVGFMIRRFFRLYPLHLATLVFLVALESLKYVASLNGLATASDIFAFQRTIPAIFVNVAFLQGTGVLDTLSWNTPSWSISCEMVAYAAFALLAITGFVTSRLFPMMIVPVFAGYAYLIVDRGTLDVTFDIGVVRCLSGFFLGALITRLPLSAFPNALTIISVFSITLILALMSGPSEIFAIPAFAILVYALRSDESTAAGLFLLRPLVFVGEISFSVYLVHYLIISIVGTLLKAFFHAQPTEIPGWKFPMLNTSPFFGDILVIATLACTLAVARFTYDHVEKPGRTLGYELTGDITTKGRLKEIANG